MALTKATVAAGGSASASAASSRSARPARSGLFKGGGGAGPGGWEPTVLYLLAFSLAEIVVVAILSRHLLKG